ncbi:MAG: RDD family protein [Actinomycetia bacterium]|nr:RDD family protein [Actinomycetes bacterium]
MSEETQASFLQRAVSGAVDATVGRVEDRVLSSTKGVIDDLEPYLAEETVPRIVDALMPYLIEQVVPQVIDGLTERLATETGPAIVEEMTPQLADELVPVLLARMRPYLEAELVPAVVDGVTPHIIEKAGPQIVAGLMPFIHSEVVPRILDDFVDDPRVRDLIREQSLGLLWDALEVLRAGLAKADDLVEHIVRRLFFREPASDGVPRDRLPPKRDRSHAGIVSRSAGAGLDLLIISLVAAQGLATTLSLVGAVIDPIPKWIVAALTFMFAWLGPLYLTVAWRAAGRTIGGAIAGYGVVSSVDGQLGVFRSVLRASVSFFLMPLWAIGMVGTAFHPLRHSWGDRLLSSRTPYLVHVERQSERSRSQWV